MCLFFKQREGSTGADDSNFGTTQGVGDSEKNVQQASEQEEQTNFGRTKRQRVLKGFNDGSWMECRKTASALFCRIFHKCPKQIFITV